MKNVFAGICTAGLMCSGFAGCQAEGRQSGENKVEEVAPPREATSLRGKTLRLDYGQTVYIVHYDDDPLRVHWQTILDGTKVEDFEAAEYRQIEEGIYFVSWIEQSGETVSQVLNLKDKKVSAFVTHTPEAGNDSIRGNRASVMLDGSITILEE